MVILDTNVVSELMRPAPDPAIESWVAERPTSSLFLTAVTEAELRFGLAVMPPGKRRDRLGRGLERMLGTGFANRVLPFDSGAARAYAGIAATRRRLGRPIAQADGQIAAIARARGMTVATRKVRDFEDIGIEIFNPWDGA
jgi:predicted nucleic acid-binding protein